MDDLTVFLFAANVLLAGGMIVIASVKRFELAIILILLSPWVSTFFISDNSNVDLAEESGFASYVRISILVVMGGIGLLRFMQVRAIDQKKIPVHLLLLAIFLVLVLVSTSYSLDPFYTLVRSLTFVAFFCFLLGLDSWLKEDGNLDLALHAIFLLVCIAGIVNVVSLLLLPERAWWRGEGRFCGITGHPNTLGSFCALYYLILLWKYPRSRTSQKLLVFTLLIMLGCLLALTGSRGSMVTTAIGLCVWLGVLGERGKVALVAGLLSIAVLVVVLVKPAVFDRNKDSVDLLDLTDRQDFWYGAFTLISERPVLGYGYAVEGKVWNDPRFNRPEYALWSGSARTSLHNGYISSLIGVGIPGSILWYLILLIPLWRCRRLPRSDYKAYVAGVMSMGLVLSFVESELAGGNSLASVVFWIAWVIAGRLSENWEATERLRDAYVFGGSPVDMYNH